MVSNSGGVNLSWDQLWSYLKDAPESIRIETLKTLDIEQCLHGVTDEVKNEILLSAPQEIRDKYLNKKEEKVFTSVREKYEYLKQKSGVWDA